MSLLCALLVPWSYAGFGVSGCGNQARHSANPCMPLPLGLKPPSVDGVLEELNRQGLMMPPCQGSLTRQRVLLCIRP